MRHGLMLTASLRARYAELPFDRLRANGRKGIPFPAGTWTLRRTGFLRARYAAQVFDRRIANSQNSRAPTHITY